mgnify:CR=1 FL=1
MENQKIWTNTLLEIKKSISASSFRTWFSGSRLLDLKDLEHEKMLIVGVKNNFVKEQLESRYAQKILDVVKNKVGESTKIIYVVSESEKSAAVVEPLFTGEAKVVVNSKVEAISINHTFDNFVVGHSNNIGFLAAKQVVDSLGSVYNPLLFYGPTGVGKTHLLQAIGNGVLSKYSGVKVVYVTCERFTNDFIDSLRNRSQGFFRDKYRNCDLLLIDDIQFLSGKESTQDEFSNTFNELYLSGKQIVLASDRHPKELGKIKERLVSRFLGGLTVDIGIPDYEMRVAIIGAKCAERKIAISDEVVNYIASSYEGGARELEGVLISVLSIMKLSGKCDIDEIRSLVERSKPKLKNVTKQEVIGAVCQQFVISEEDLLGPRRKYNLMFPRQVLMYVLRKQLNLTLSEIGNVCGGRDHSTVVHSIDKIERLIVEGGSLKDSILRVQSQLG